jgi:hypothetical protein
MDANHFDFSQGVDTVYCFLDDGYSAVMTKVVSGSDPVELESGLARRLASALVELADRLDAGP